MSAGSRLRVLVGSRMHVHDLVDTARRAVAAWWKGDSLQLGAALAYYTVFSLAPILLVTIAVAGLALDPATARDAVLETLQGLVGPEGSRAIADLLEAAALNEGGGVFATALGVATLLFGASGAFGQLQSALNRIWDVEAPRAGLLSMIRRRLVSFGALVVLAFLLLVSLVLAAGIAMLDQVLSTRLAWLQPLAAVVHWILSLVVASLVFAAIFKLLPDRDTPWADVWIGGIATALFFEIGKWAIGLYMGNAAVGSAYGAAGSFVVVLVWVYYSAQLVFLGAEFTQAWSQRVERVATGVDSAAAH